MRRDQPQGDRQRNLAAPLHSRKVARVRSGRLEMHNEAKAVYPRYPFIADVSRSLGHPKANTPGSQALSTLTHPFKT